MSLTNEYGETKNLPVMVSEIVPGDGGCGFVLGMLGVAALPLKILYKTTSTNLRFKLTDIGNSETGFCDIPDTNGEWTEKVFTKADFGGSVSNID